MNTLTDKIEEAKQENEKEESKSLTTKSAAKAIEKSGSKDNVIGLIEGLGMKTQIKNALPKQISPDRFIRIITTVLRKNPKLMACDKMSLLGAIITSAQLGLEPGPLNQCHFIPYGNQCEFQLGYEGILELMRRSGEIKSMDGAVVYEKDEFSYEKGLNPKLYHKPCLEENRGEKKCAYFVAHFKDGGYYFLVMGKNQIMKAKACAKTQSVWKDWEEEMWLKTVIKKARKFMPISPELKENLEVDSIVRTDATGDLGQVKDNDVTTVDYTVLSSD